MTETHPPSKRQRQVDKFLRAADIGTIAVVAHPFIYVGLENGFEYEAGGPILIPSLFIALLFAYIIAETYSVFAMFFRRKTDEFTLSMWHMGTSWAFFAAIVWLLLGVWVEAAFLGADVSAAFEAHQAAQEQGLDVGEFDPPIQEDSVIDRFSVQVILLAFFAGCQFKRLRGDL